MSANRRRWPRVPAEALKGVKVWLSSGGEVRLLDLSLGGARFTSRERLLPGLGMSLRFKTPEGDQDARGRVVHSKLVKLADGSLGYEVGMVFDEPLSGPLAAQTGGTK